MNDELHRIEDIRDRLQTKPDSDCRQELVEILDILSGMIAAVRGLQREAERHD